jgi:hypothetical protein
MLYFVMVGIQRKTPISLTCSMFMVVFIVFVGVN